MKNKLSDKQIIKSFLYTVEEYKRFEKSIPTEKNHLLLDTYTEADYIGIQTKLMILRKYSYYRDLVYIPTVIESAKKMFPVLGDALGAIKKKYDEVEKNQLQSISSEGNKMSLFEMQECVLYGLYLHADEDKIIKLLDLNEALYFSMTRKFVEELEVVLLELYELLVTRIDDKYERKKSQKAPVIFAGNLEQSKQEVKGSPYWGNLYGKDATDEDLLETLLDNSEEDMLILLKCLAFLNEAKKDDYSIEILEGFVFPPTREQWGDFSMLSEACRNDLSNVGWSTRVRYNNKHDMAYVHLFPNIDEPFLLDQPHVITELSVITLVHENPKYGWRIFAIGGKVDEYKEEISILEGFRRVFGKKKS